MHYLELIRRVSERVGQVLKVVATCPTCGRPTLTITLADRTFYCASCREHGAVDYLFSRLRQREEEGLAGAARDMQTPPRPRGRGRP